MFWGLSSIEEDFPTDVGQVPTIEEKLINNVRYDVAYQPCSIVNKELNPRSIHNAINRQLLTIDITSISNRRNTVWKNSHLYLSVRCYETSILAFKKWQNVL